jgi:putative hydrolase of the HAD superfamily
MNILEGIRAVVFDAVGTVILPNPGASEVYARVAASHGIAVPDDLGRLLWARFRLEDQWDRDNEWRTSEARERERWRNIVNAALPGTTDAVFEELFQHFSKPSAWRVIDEAARIVPRLRSQGYLLGMGSNYDARLRRVVGGTPALQPLAGHLVISSEVGWRKPAGGFFAAVCAELECDPPEILFVGDDVENDAAGASAAGMRTLLVDSPAAWRALGNALAD